MARLDKTKPFGETLGLNETRYHQAGKDFDAEGNEILVAGRVPEPTTGGAPGLDDDEPDQAPEPVVSKKPKKVFHPQGLE